MTDVDVENPYNPDRDRLPVINPLALPHGGYARERLFRMWAGQIGTTFGYVWADSDESAFEEWVEYLDEHAPGHLVTVGMDELKEAAADLDIDWDDSWPDWNNRKFTKVAEHAEADLTTIGHTTLKHGGTHIPSYEWGFDEIEHGEEFDKVWQACAEAYESEYEELPDPPRGVTPPTSQKRMKLKLDGVAVSRRPSWTVPPRRK